MEIILGIAGLLFILWIVGGMMDAGQSTKKVISVLEKTRFLPMDLVDGGHEIHFVLDMKYEHEFRALTAQELKFLFSRCENIIENTRYRIKFNTDFAERRFLIGFKEMMSWHKER